ncbi:hypothetical protein CCH79_00014482 [Gambusia affinis]|uniref:Zonadhesin n=1 Tax=Gambusia affinis TaxID=33528 RepID=A0A315UTL7_GAMAF|nr:hypothetical protein CCH79_00014482 [Gambusia affinis]
MDVIFPLALPKQTLCRQIQVTSPQWDNMSQKEELLPSFLGWKGAERPNLRSSLDDGRTTSHVWSLGLQRNQREDAVLTSCDFNRDSEPFCSFTQDASDNSDWTRHKGSTPTPGTGPPGDYPDGNGYYIYHECDNVANGQKARLLSPVISSPASKICVHFRYYMYGSDANNVLKVLSKTSAGENEVWKKTGIQSPSWLGDSITVSKASSESVTIVFEAQRGLTSFCDSALDNIVITEGGCDVCDFECDFDTPGNLCRWTVHNDNPLVYGFFQYSGPTETEGTGPDDDFSKPGLGEYMLLDSSEAIPGESSQLRSPVIPFTSGCLELSFHYYLYGTSTTMEIRVHAIKGGNLGNPLFTVTGNQGQGWKPAEVRLKGTGNIQFVIVGKYGETPQTDVAVDAVCIKSCTGSQDCVVSGDPHYNTFDKKFYSFMGTCTYTLARTCKNNTGPWFSVEAKNEERGGPGLSYLRKLYITVNGITVTLMKSRRTLVNGVRVALPHSPSPLMSISLAGQYVTLETTFGLRVRWDGNHYAQISVPSSYYDQMCGLCGDYDGNPNNDFAKPDGSLGENVNDFGNSWQTKEDEDERCTQGSKPDPDCDPSLEAELVKPDKCGKITDPAGPFRDCIAVVDPTSFFRSCVYDMCQFNGQQHVLCDQLQAYTDACQSAGATVHQWRTPDFCPLACPPNSSYSLCVSSCPETCLGAAGPPGCEDVCVEGCECNPGFILSDDRCVALKDCGCLDASGTYYPVGEDWYLEGCEQKCECQEGGLLQCYNTSCRPGTESCQLHDGRYECRPLGNGICSVSGDPHYTTFDKKTHNYMGACSYTLTKPCNESSGLPYFTVDTMNEHRGSNKKVSYVRAVVINVNDVTFILGKGRKVQVNGTLVVPPVTSISGVQIYLSGKFVVLETSFGLRVRFDGNHHADVSVPTSYNGLLCGMCGNFNGEPKDDNLKPDNTAASNTNDLGDSWQVPDPRPDCTNGGGEEDCDEDVEEEAQKPTSCGMITDPNGIFKPCHSVVPPESFFENCVYDLCATGGQTVALCQAIESYADMCAAAGVPIHWRDNTFCPLKCPAGSHYEPCASACPQPSCQDPAGPGGSCSHPCVEGCVCNEGLVLSGDKCVPLSECGCTDEDGKYRPVGDAWFTETDCSERCKCNGNHNVTCEPWRCSPAQECKVVEGVLGCHSTGKGVCHVAGDPHYYTFDGVMHTFMGTCTYTLVEVCNSSMVTPFKVVAKNEERGQPEASYVRYVKIYLPHDTVVELQKGRRVLLNGRRVRTPLTVDAPGAKVITSGSYLLLDTNFGLQVKFDGVHHLEITIPGEYFNKVCGMCGNYNHNSSDDNLMPDKRPAKDVIELGNSWKSDGDSDPGCQPDTRPDIHPNCTTEEEDLYSSQCAAVIMSDRFKPCHALVPPEVFLDNCIYDMCEYDGMQTTLCDNVEAYAQACQSAGVTISWRNNTFCPLPCPTNSHYSDCTPPCPPTCSDLFPIFCHLPPTTCVEGCQCNAGYVLSDDKCVPLDKCGCVDSDGEYHDVGDSWLTDKCSESCTCNLGGGITCKSHSCNSNSVCALDKNGDLYCQPSKFDRCSITGDPHHKTFDGFNHHFQGAHTYILTRSHNLLDSQVPLLVRGKNLRRGGNKKISFLDQMYVDVYGVNVRFLQKKVILVNGERVTPPLSPVRGLTITMNSKEVQLSTDFGLTVRFDGNIRGEIELPSTYRHSVRGLCGNYDGITRNEYMKPDGTVVRSLNEFGESWRTNDRVGDGLESSDVQTAVHVHRREVETDPDSGFETSDCSTSQLSDYNSVKKCGALSDPEGPFEACHDTVEPRPYQDYEAYATACQEAGVKLGAWRQKLNCGAGRRSLAPPPQTPLTNLTDCVWVAALTCGANSSYSQCMTACPSSCADLAAPSECDITSCVEGCQCASGFVMSEGICVPYPKCGCTFLNRYYPLNEKFVTEDCSQSCDCTSRGAVCQPKSCQEGYLCTIFDLKRDCFKASPCLSYPCLNGGTCVAANNNTYTCTCQEGFHGDNCEREVTEAPGGLATKWIILIAVLVSAVVVAIVITIVCVCIRKNKKNISDDGSISLKSTSPTNGHQQPLALLLSWDGVELWELLGIQHVLVLDLRPDHPQTRHPSGIVQPRLELITQNFN